MPSKSADMVASIAAGPLQSLVMSSLLRATASAQGATANS